MNNEAINEAAKSGEIKNNLTSPEHWQRLVYMLLFAVMLHVASIAMWVLVALQFIFTLLTGKDNRNLRDLGKSMTLFISQALDYLTFNTETKPFPFADWPRAASADAQNQAMTAPAETKPEEHS